jgi:acetyl esterase/lipase
MLSARMRRALLLLLAACSGSPAMLPDSGAPDSGSPPDAGTPDAGPTDAGIALRFRTADAGEVSSILYSDVVSVEVTGLSPGDSIGLKATMTPWSSFVTFTAASDGTVDTGRDAPGPASSYSGVDPDGVFWSMDTSTFNFAMSADVDFQVLAGGNVAAERTLARTFELPGTRTVTPDAGFVGTLVLPPASGPVPALIAFGGSEGGISGGLTYAEELAPMGYGVLAVAYFGAPGLPQDLTNVPLEYFDGPLAWLKSRPEIDPARIGVIGGSRGGELCLLLAARYVELKAAVCDVASGYVWSGTDSNFDPAWTVDGGALPSVPYHGSLPAYVMDPHGGTAEDDRLIYLDDLANAPPDALEAARTKVEDAGASIAMFAAGDDQLWPSCPMSQVAMDHLVASGHAASHFDSIDCFADAGHLFPGALGFPTTWSSFIKEPGVHFAVGGTPQGNAEASRQRHEKVRVFLEKTLGH